LVAVELEQMRRFARRHALEILERQAGGTLSDEEAMDLRSKPGAGPAGIRATGRIADQLGEWLVLGYKA
jgi:hypothetical protein